MKTIFFALTRALFLTLVLASATMSSVLAADLVGSLSEQLDVTEVQAAGGAGAIFQLAKDRLGPEDFVKVSDAVPNMDTLLEAAPETGAFDGMLGTGLSSLGGEAGSLGDLAALAMPFEELGMSPEMAGKFIPVILDYVKSTGGESVMGMLKGALL